MPASAEPSQLNALPDHANEIDTRALAIDKVGIKDLAYPIKILDRDKEVQHTVARANLYVSLPHHFKGTHMSRFIEILNVRRGEMTIRTMPQLLEEIQNRLGADDAHIELRFPYFISKKAPVSGVESLMEYQASFLASKRGGEVDFVLGVQVPVKSLCPCSKSISQYGAHNQRSLVDVQVRSSDFVWIEDVVSVVEECASAPLFALLKREDEKYVTELAYENPKFVEDLVRDVVLSLQDLPGVEWLHVSAENQESIHNHSAYAEIEWTRDDSSVQKPAVMIEPVTKAARTDTLPFGEWLAAQRQARTFSQQRFAEQIGVSAAHLSRVEAGDKRLSNEVLVRAAKLLGHDPDTMMLKAGVIPAKLLEAIEQSPTSFIEWANQQGA